MRPLAACTIISKNYLSFARVLARSFLEFHPQGKFFVLLVDRVDDYFRPEQESFVLTTVEDLPNIPDLQSFLFKYSQLECSTAVKPSYLEFLINRYELQGLIYFDPDILVMSPLTSLAQHLDEHSLLLTPHLNAPIEDGMFPDELAILRAGAYNLGFIAIRNDSESQRFLDWWKRRVYDHCVVRTEQGLFVDQKWIDLVPGLFQGVRILREPGYNVAYWNLHGRKVELNNGSRVNGEALYFFHFSGIQPESLDLVSKHQDRFRLQDLGEVADLYRRYKDQLFEAGYEDSIHWPYAFGQFDNGIQIPDLARDLYLSLGPRRGQFGNPFSTAKRNSYFRWLNAAAAAGPIRPYLSRLLQHLYEVRPDVQRRFPDVTGADFQGFCRWLADFGQIEYRLDPAFLEPARPRGTPVWTPSGVRRRLHKGLIRASRSDWGRRAKRAVKRRLGSERTQSLQQRLTSSEARRGVVGRLATLPRVEKPGINVTGYLRAETGMGEGARSMARAMQATGIPCSLHNLSLNVLARCEDSSFEPVESSFPYDINLLFVNADQAPLVVEHIGPQVLGGRYNIGFWLWELSLFPEELQPSFRFFHEIWTPSTFCVDALSAASPVPVRRLPLPVEIPDLAGLGRSHFGLSEDGFVFLYVFDFLSYWERKNPIAVIRAFRRAFKDQEDVLLVLKAAHSDFDIEGRDRILDEIGDANVRFIDQEWSRREVLGLIRCSDCYVSPHRSEGFGLTMAEAMFLARPVIATPYSGPGDFFNLCTGLPIRYRLVELEHDVGPYRAGSVWAEPEVEHIAELMKWAVENPSRAREVAEVGRRQVEQQLSYAAVGKTLHSYFQQIVRRTNPVSTVP